MKKTLKIMCFLILTGVSCLAKAQLAVRLNAQVVKCDAIVSVQVENISGISIDLKSIGAPWANSFFGASVLVQRIGPSREMLSQVFGVEESDVVLQLRSGEIVERSFRLSDRFPDLAKSLSKYDLALYWNYAIAKKEWSTPVIALGSVLLRKCDSEV
jgi:hypothetical protein